MDTTETVIKDMAFIVRKDSTKTCTVRHRTLDSSLLGVRLRRLISPPDVSKERTAFIFKSSRSMDLETLKKTATHFFEPSGGTDPATRHHIPDDWTHQSHIRENSVKEIT